MANHYFDLPPNLPRPEDDGAAAHLTGMHLPSVTLRATDGREVDLAGLRDRVVVYVYPMTGRPGVPLPAGWDDIPGARGCTPQSCGFRDHDADLRALGATVFGLSTQDTVYQEEVRARLRLPFALLSDARLQLKRVLGLPTFTVSGMELYKRLTLVAEGGVVQKVFYPVFPPDRNAADVVAWLRARAASQPLARGL